MRIEHKIRTMISHVLVLFTLTILSACSGEKPVKGFVLPQGDIAQGKQVFVDFNCHGCHTIPDTKFPEPLIKPPVVIDIGGKVYRVKNYGELMTSIVNPDHVISPKYLAMLEKPERASAVSPMPDFSETMTIAELTDLVEFLHAQYTKLQPRYYRGYQLKK